LQKKKKTKSGDTLPTIARFEGGKRDIGRNTKKVVSSVSSSLRA